MRDYPLKNLSAEELAKTLESIAFYKKVKLVDEAQFQTLIRHSRLTEFKMGEVVIEAGQRDFWLYSLLKGQLAVYVGEGPAAIRRIGDISPGEAFGDLSILLSHKRTATVISDTCYRRSLVFCTDFSIFGALPDFSRITLSTKLIYYRILVHNLRWKLEMYRSQHPNTVFSSSHHRIKLFTGNSDSFDELESLHFQAQQLAKLLLQWNYQLSHDIDHVLSVSPP